MKIGAQEKRGCSRRIGSVQKDSAVRAVARGGHASFRYAPLRVPPRHLHLKRPRERRTGATVARSQIWRATVATRGWRPSPWWTRASLFMPRH